jgi:DNA ligase-associated metallophosphoesterase
MTEAARQLASAPGSPGERIGFRGHDFVALGSGALHWPAQDLLLVADLHLEKMASFATGRQFLPPYDTGATLRRLAVDIEATAPAGVVCLGDSFHRDGAAGELLAADRRALESLMAGRDWIWIAGNHDPAPHGLDGDFLPDFSVAGLSLSHHPDATVSGQIAGHLHPAARVRINGRSTRRPCFVWDDDRMVLPAYGVSTGSLDILGPAFGGLLVPHRLNIVMLGRDRPWRVGRRHLV